MSKNRMDEKNNNHCDWFDHSSIWHYPLHCMRDLEGQPLLFCGRGFQGHFI